MSETEVQRVIERFRLNRCDWCGWPLVDEGGMGCVVDYCSQRPRPDADETAMADRAALRALIADAAALREENARLREALAEDAADCRKLMGAMVIGGWNAHAAMDFLSVMERRAMKAAAPSPEEPADGH